MIHARTAIRQAIVAALADAQTLADERVHDTPVWARTAFPALTVEDLGEDQGQIGTARGPSATVRRQLLIEVSAEVQQVEAYAATRDQLVAEVEACIAGLSIPGVSIIKPAGYRADVAPGNEKPVAVGRQRFEVTYLTTQGVPSTLIGA